MLNSSNSSKLKVGIVLGKWVGGGVESVLMNYYRNIDKTKFEFDFICDSDSIDIPYNDIESLGGKVIICPPYQELFKYVRSLETIFKENDYKLVHSNINSLSVFPLYAAKKAGVPIRIAHSHSTSNRVEFKKYMIKNMLRPFSKVYATHYFACTEHAGKWLFGDKYLNDGKIVVINNGIDIDSYTYNSQIRNKIRKELGISENEILIGHIGRFIKQKNHEFLIELFYELHKIHPNYKLILIGQGPLHNTIVKKVKKLGIEDSVIFLGQVHNVNDYYQAMDLFLFPSLYEGLGIVMIEAQCSGLDCIASTNVPIKAKVSEKAHFVDLDEPLNMWIDKITGLNLHDRSINKNNVRDAGFDIKLEGQKLQKIYMDLFNEVGD